MGVERPAAEGEATRAVVGIDVGGTKTDLVIADAAGRVLASARVGSLLPQHAGAAAAIAHLRDRLATLTDTLTDTLPGPLRLVHATLSLSGADLPEEVAALQAVAAVDIPSGDVVVENDMFALLRAGTSAPNAVAVGCGTGMNCVGRRADGALATFPALGHLSGDWGGGAPLSHEVLWHAVRGEDGRGSETALSAAVAAHLGTATVHAAVAGVHLGNIPDRLANELTPVLFRVAETTDDAVAHQLITRQADEIVTLARVALARLDLRNSPSVVVLGGSVLAAQSPLLLRPVRAGLAADAPLARVRVSTVRPVLGSVLSSLDRMHGGHTPADAERTLNRTLAGALS